MGESEHGLYIYIHLNSYLFLLGIWLSTSGFCGTLFSDKPIWLLCDDILMANNCFFYLFLEWWRCLSVKQPQQPLEGSNSYMYFLGEHSWGSMMFHGHSGPLWPWHQDILSLPKNGTRQEVPRHHDNIGWVVLSLAPMEFCPLWMGHGLLHLHCVLL